MSVWVQVYVSLEMLPSDWTWLECHDPSGGAYEVSSKQCEPAYVCSDVYKRVSRREQTPQELGYRPFPVAQIKNVALNAVRNVAYLKRGKAISRGYDSGFQRRLNVSFAHIEQPLCWSARG